RAWSRCTSLASSSIRTSAWPSSAAHARRPWAACRPNTENLPDSDRQAPTRSRLLVPHAASTVSLSHLLFVPELVPVSGHHGVLALDREISGVEHGPQHADHRNAGRQPQFDGFLVCWHTGYQVIDGSRDLPPNRPFGVLDQCITPPRIRSGCSIGVPLA